MDRKRFEHLKHCFEKEEYANLVSWAIWDGNDIKDLSMFDDQHLKETLPKLKDHIVIMGLNASNSAESRKETWAGFHNKHQGGRDSWLREIVKLHPYLEGAYMTDVFKIVESKSDNVKELIRDKTFRSEQYDMLERELNILGDNLTIILIGRDAQKYFCLFEKEKDKAGLYRLLNIPHYAGRLSKAAFLKKVEIIVHEINH